MSAVASQAKPPAVRVAPCWTVPLITGTCVLTGGAAATGPVGAAVAVPDPTPLAAVTVTVTVRPSSAGVSSYVSPVAPSISRQSPPSQRSHR